MSERNEMFLRITLIWADIWSTKNSSMAVNSKCSFTDRIHSLQFLQHIKLIYFSSNENAFVGWDRFWSPVKSCKWLEMGNNTKIIQLQSNSYKTY
jgi:hypothetical protein